MSTLGKNNFNGKSKTKPVEFSERAKSLSNRTKLKRLMGERENERAKLKEDESDLTDLEELEASLKKSIPRRLRGNSRCIQADEFGANEARPRTLRKTSTREAKEKINSLKEEDEELDLPEDELSDEGINEDAVEEGEVDELISSTPSPPPPRGRRTPLRTRLRPRRRPVPPSSDGDDEGGNMEEAEEAEEEDVELMEGSEDGSGFDETIAMEPRKLRNGKIVVDMHMEEDIEEEGEEAEQEGEEEGTEDGADGGDEEEEDQSDECTEAGDVDVDADEETDEDEVMEENDGELLRPREICTYLYLAPMTSGLDSGDGQNSC